MDNPNHTKLNLGEVKDKLIRLTEKTKNIKLKKLGSLGKKVDIDKLKTTYLKIALIAVMLISIVALSITGYRAYQASLVAFDVYLGNEKIGTVREQDSVLSIMDSLQKDLSKTYNIDVVLNEDLRFEETKVKDEFITDTEELRKTIKDRTGFLVYGYVLIVDGEEVGALKSQEEIEEIINKIKEPFEASMAENDNIKEIKIVEDVKIEKQLMPLYKIGNGEDLYNHLLTSSEEIKTHTVEVGESFWTIAKFYGITVDELIAANPDKKPEKLQIGDEIKLVVPKPVLTVATISEVEYTEKIKYETEIEYSDNMYKTEKKTKVAGQAGEKRVLANEIRHNGYLVAREILEEEVIKEPTTEIIVRGTKEPPKTVATGVFLMPTRGTISSRYGMRSGRMHYGLDIAAKTGTPIYAADGGKVVYAGYKGNYGYLVEIDHGNGFKTRYAHCSKILVKVGDKVYKGQHIANIGSTGRSTGPHLHFEVLKNGKNQNPANYLK